VAEEVEQTEEGQSEILDRPHVLMTHERINRALSGEIDKLDDGFARVILETIDEMSADELGLVHGGFIFSAADFAAMAAVNDENVVLASAQTQFLAPVKVGDVVVFEARVRQKEGRKRNVHVKAHMLDIKVFEAEFSIVVLDRHILKLKLLENAEEAALEDGE